MNQLNRKMSDRIISVQTAINDKLLVLPPIATIAPILGVTADEMSTELSTITKNCLTYQQLLLSDTILVTEPTIIKCETKLSAFEKAAMPDLITTFNDLSGFLQEQLDAANGTDTGSTDKDA